ncbi:MAG: hypothetical protein Q7U89_08470 [Coriobacteriia bacterium]|nr:hypothetical protein [Coriobacteriia bacterium]
MTPRVLYCGVDTLEATFDGTLLEELPARLDTAKASAQATDTPVPFEIAGQSFYVSGRGLGKYAWVLSDHRMQVRISRAKKGLPVIGIRLWASALATYGHEALYRDACEIAAGLGEVVPNTLSRIDLCLDVQGFEFTDADFKNLVCAASYRAVHKDGDGVTFQVGKGDVVMRIYRKDAELRVKDKLSYAKVWERIPEYDADAPVWRIEVQLRGSVLKELSARSVDVAFTKLGKLFAFGMHWCELRVPSADSTSTRWPVEPTWSELSAAWGTSNPEPRIRRASAMENQERVVARITGAVATLGAYSGQSELVDVLIYALPLMEARLKDKHIEFSDLVAAKTARIGYGDEVPF